GVRSGSTPWSDAAPARPRATSSAGPRRIVPAGGSASAPPSAGNGLVTPVTNGSDVSVDVTAPARTSPAAPPPTRYRCATTLRKPNGTLAPCTPSPNV